MLPLSTDLYGGGRNTRVAAQADVLAEGLRGHDAIVVFFDDPPRVGAECSTAALVAALGLELEHRYDDGATFRVGGS